MTRLLLTLCGLVCHPLISFSPARADEAGVCLMPNAGSGWKCVLTLDQRRQLIAGDPRELRAAIGSGADLRIYSEFIHNEHIDPKSASAEPIQELSWVSRAVDSIAANAQRTCTSSTLKFPSSTSGLQRRGRLPTGSVTDNI